MNNYFLEIFMTLTHWCVVHSTVPFIKREQNLGMLIINHEG